MSLLARFQTIGEADKSKAVQKLITASTPDFDFFLMIILSMLMASFGLLVDSTAIVIGSMLIAPILYPVLSLSLGIAMSDHKLITRSLYTLGKAALFGISAAVLATLIFSPSLEGGLTGEVVSRTQPSLLFFAVAVIAGLAISFTLVKPQLSEILPGVAVSVALIPPLAVIGVGIAKLDWEVVSGSLLLFLINVIGIIFAAMVSFSLMDVYEKKKLAESAIKKEDHRVRQEKKKIEEFEESEHGK